MYKYGEEQPSVAIAKENSKLAFLFFQKENFCGPTNLNILTILGVAYWVGDATEEVRLLVLDGSTLDVQASDKVFGDTWAGVQKSLVDVYRYGCSVPQMQIVEEIAFISLSIPKVKPNTVLMDTNNLLEHGDISALAALNANGNFISCDSSKRFVAAIADVEKGCKLILKKSPSSSYLKI